MKLDRHPGSGLGAAGNAGKASFEELIDDSRRSQPRNTVGSSWRRVVRLLEQDDRVTPRQRGFVVLAQPQGLIGSTLLVAVPNELTREVLQTQLKDALDDALRKVFSDDILCAIDVDTDLVPIHESRNPSSNRPRAGPADRAEAAAHAAEHLA